jgi:undecaprenyl phosphate N,N'-diacetylbacillosamine 1-phosphate transferase
MYKRFFKRLLDMILSSLALPLWLLILIVVAPCIYIQDKGSIFYNAKRLGKDGKEFKMYKFRSMKMNAPDIRNEDGSTFNAEDDPRMTKIGKFIRKTSIDETPQILNILKGDMSIIGPRPDLPEMLSQYTEFELKKLSVRPGITGYNQAFYRNNNDLLGRFTNDVHYTEKVSLGFDIKIFIKTIIIVLRRENVYRNDEALKSENLK